MKKTVFFVLMSLSVALGGCATLQIPGPVAAPESLVKIGMTRDQVKSFMDHPVTVGVEIDPATGATKPVEAPSLYSTEFMVRSNIAYLVDFYILKKDVTALGATGEETLPFIFENNILIGKGSEALKALQDK